MGYGYFFLEKRVRTKIWELTCILSCLDKMLGGPYCMPATGLSLVSSVVNLKSDNSKTVS